MGLGQERGGVYYTGRNGVGGTTGAWVYGSANRRFDAYVHGMNAADASRDQSNLYIFIRMVWQILRYLGTDNA